VGGAYEDDLELLAGKPLLVGRARWLLPLVRGQRRECDEGGEGVEARGHRLPVEREDGGREWHQRQVVEGHCRPTTRDTRERERESARARESKKTRDRQWRGMVVWMGWDIQRAFWAWIFWPSSPQVLPTAKSRTSPTQ
jgi:hypothetical protein